MECHLHTSREAAALRARLPDAAAVAADYGLAHGAEWGAVYRDGGYCSAWLDLRPVDEAPRRREIVARLRAAGWLVTSDAESARYGWPLAPAIVALPGAPGATR